MARLPFRAQPRPLSYSAGSAALVNSFPLCGCFKCASGFSCFCFPGKVWVAPSDLTADLGCVSPEAPSVWLWHVFTYSPHLRLLYTWYSLCTFKVTLVHSDRQNSYFHTAVFPLLWRFWHLFFTSPQHFSSLLISKITKIHSFKNQNLDGV
jgi:hypothetical protein